jgi:hypothetical protein
MLPGLILLGEIILIVIFTIGINIKEAKEGAFDGDFADSDDEDDPKKEK